MSRHEYDIEKELDDGLSFGSQVTRITEKAWAEKMKKEKMKATTKKQLFDAIMGTRMYQWELSLPQGAPVVGKIAVPVDEAPGRDLVMKTVFEKLFSSVKVRQIRGQDFEVTFEGRTIGHVRIPVDSYLDEYTQRRVEMDVWGRPRYFDSPRPSTEGGFAAIERDIQNQAMGWLRRNLILEVKGLDEHYPPYEPRIPQKSKTHVGTKPWIDGLGQVSRYERDRLEALHEENEFHAACKETQKKPGVGWQPVNEGAQDMAEGGVNLSLLFGGGATNMAHSTQMQQTSRAGERVDKVRSGKLLRMHMEGRIIG